MITILNFCSLDRDTALRLLRWITKLGGVGKHDIILQMSKSVNRAEDHLELVTEAEKAFASVSTVVCDVEDERGWPWSPNSAWTNALLTIRKNIQKPFLWLEPDCTPLVPEWLDRIEKEYERAKRPFMGAEVFSPSHRMSGVAVYPPNIFSFFIHRKMPDLFIRNEAFDAYFAPEILPHANFTHLFQEMLFVQREPPLLPTFPDQASLSVVSPAAVLFHRCKDGSLIERLEEGMEPLAALTPPPIAAESELRAENIRLKAALAAKVVPVQPKKRRSSETREQMLARMAALRAKRKKVAA